MSTEEDQSISTAAALRRAFDKTFAEAPIAVEETEDVLAIRMSGDPYAIRLSEIAGLHASRKVVPAPSSVSEFAGIASLRGVMAPIYDLAALFGYRTAETLRWLVLIRASKPVGLGFETFEAHLRVPRHTFTSSEGSSDSRTHVRGAVRVAGINRPIIHMASVLEAITRRAGTGVSYKEQ